MASLTQARLSELSGAILRQEKGVAVVTIFDKKGELVFREVAKKDERGSFVKGITLERVLLELC